MCGSGGVSLLIISPDSLGTVCPLSGRNSTYRPVQILEAGSGYIHEKIRQRGGRTLCLPFLRWLHRFGRPLGLRYPNRWEDRVRNYMIGFTELGLDTAEMKAHFDEFLGAEASARIFTEIGRELDTDLPAPLVRVN